MAKMNWNQAQTKIKRKIRKGTDINNAKSTYRIIKDANAIFNSSRYGYNNERGYLVPIGKTSDIKIPWSMLKKCFSALKIPSGYGGAFF